MMKIIVNWVCLYVLMSLSEIGIVVSIIVLILVIVQLVIVLIIVLPPWEVIRTIIISKKITTEGFLRGLRVVVGRNTWHLYIFIRLLRYV